MDRMVEGRVVSVGGVGAGLYLVFDFAVESNEVETMVLGGECPPVSLSTRDDAL